MPRWHCRISSTWDTRLWHIHHFLLISRPRTTSFSSFSAIFKQKDMSLQWNCIQGIDHTVTRWQKCANIQASYFDRFKHCLNALFQEIKVESKVGHYFLYNLTLIYSKYWSHLYYHRFYHRKKHFDQLNSGHFQVSTVLVTIFFMRWQLLAIPDEPVFHYLIQRLNARPLDKSNKCLTKSFIHYTAILLDVSYVFQEHLYSISDSFDIWLSWWAHFWDEELSLCFNYFELLFSSCN